MPITAYISIAKDIAITGMVGFLVWFLYHSGSNAVKVADLQVVERKIEANSQAVNDALAEANSQMGNLAHSIDANRKPVVVRVPASPGPVSGTSAPVATCAGGNDAGPGVDVRPQLNQLEEKYEAAFAYCRALKRIATK